MIIAFLALILASLIIPSGWAAAQSAQETTQAQADAAEGANQVSAANQALRERLAKLEGAMAQSDRADERQANLIAFLGIMTTVLAAGITVSIFVLTLKNPRDARRAAREVANEAIKEANEAIKNAKDSIEETRKEFSEVVADSKQKSERANKRMDELETLVATARVQGEEAGKHLTKIEEGVEVAKMLNELRASEEATAEVTDDQKLKLAEAVAESAGKAESEWSIDQFKVAISKALYSDEAYGRAKELSNEMLELFPVDNDARKFALSNRAKAELDEGEFLAAERTYTSLVELLEQLRETESPEYVYARHQRAFMQERLLKYADAERELLEVIPLSEKVNGKEARNPLISRHILGLCILDQDRPKEAEILFESLLHHSKRSLGESDSVTLTVQHEYARSILAQGRAVEAEEIYRDILERRKELGEWDATETLPTRHELARSLLEQGNPQLAQEMLAELAQFRLAKFGPNSPEVSVTRSVLAKALVSLGKQSEAIEILEDVIRVREASSRPTDQYYSQLDLCWLAMAGVEAGEIEKAKRALGEVSESVVAQHFRRLDYARLAYARALVADKTGDRETGDAEIAKSLEIYREIYPEEHVYRQKAEQYAIDRDKSDD